MAALTYLDVLPRLWETLPELHPYYDSRANKLYASGKPHIVYGSILVEYLFILEAQLNSPSRDSAERILHKAFSLLDELVASDDPESRYLAECSVFESLLQGNADVRRFERFMKPATRRLVAQIVADLGLT